MGRPARKLTAKDADEKLAHRRLTVLELAERLGKLTAAMRKLLVILNAMLRDRQPWRAPQSA